MLVPANRLSLKCKNKIVHTLRAVTLIQCDTIEAATSRSAPPNPSRAAKITSRSLVSVTCQSSRALGFWGLAYTLPALWLGIARQTATFAAQCERFRRGSKLANLRGLTIPVVHQVTFGPHDAMHARKDRCWHRGQRPLIPGITMAINVQQFKAVEYVVGEVTASSCMRWDRSNAAVS